MIFELQEFKKDNYEISISHFRLDKPEAVAVIFPGAGYSHMGPCLYYPSNLFLNNNIEVINFEYDLRKNRLNGDEQKDYADYLDFLMWCLEQYDLPDRKIALSKSIGTRILSSKLPSIFEKHIWLTPAIKDQFVIDRINEESEKSLVVIGTEDPFYDEDILSQLRTNGVRVYEVEGADHGLDIAGSVHLSLEEIGSMLSQIEILVFGDII